MTHILRHKRAKLSVAWLDLNVDIGLDLKLDKLKLKSESKE